MGDGDSPSRTFYLRTGSGSEDKTALYLLGADDPEHRSILTGPLFYRIHYFEGYHLSVTAGVWSHAPTAGGVGLRGVEAVVFTDVVEAGGDSPDHGSGLFEYQRIDAFEEQWPLQARPGLTIEEINTWGAAYIPDDWAVRSWADAQRLADLVVGEGVRSGAMPRDLVATVPENQVPPSPEPEGDEEDDWWDDEEDDGFIPYEDAKQLLESVRAETARREAKDAKWAWIGIGGFGFVAGAAFALTFARFVGPRRAGDVFMVTFAVIPVCLVGLYLLWRALWRKVKRW